MAENVLIMASYFPPNKLQILVVFVLTLDNSVLNEVNQTHYGIHVFTPQVIFAPARVSFVLIYP